MRISRDICGEVLKQKGTKETKDESRTIANRGGGKGIEDEGRLQGRQCAVNRLLTRAALLVAIFRNHL